MSSRYYVSQLGCEANSQAGSANMHLDSILPYFSIPGVPIILGWKYHSHKIDLVEAG